MTSEKSLKAVFEKYSTHPEFLRQGLTDSDQRGAIDDTVLHVASRIGAIKGMKVLIDADANVNIVGDLGNTPRPQAAMMDQFNAVKFLLKYGAAKHMKSEFEQIPLEISELNENTEIIRLLRAD
ncbi:ankyrin repeat domain-containing protein [Burkholderia stagnalis]